MLILPIPQKLVCQGHWSLRAPNPMSVLSPYLTYHQPLKQRIISYSSNAFFTWLPKHQTILVFFPTHWPLFSASSADSPSPQSLHVVSTLSFCFWRPSLPTLPSLVLSVLKLSIASTYWKSLDIRFFLMNSRLICRPTHYLIALLTLTWPKTSQFYSLQISCSFSYTSKQQFLFQLFRLKGLDHPSLSSPIHQQIL